MSITSYCRILILLVGTLFVNFSYSAETAWFCASKKTDIPDGYVTVEIAEDLDACEYPNQGILIKQVNDANFWMCNFDYIGAPSGYVVTQTSTNSTCGCRELARTDNGRKYCSTIGARGFLGWPMILVRKRNR